MVDWRNQPLPVMGDVEEGVPLVPDYAWNGRKVAVETFKWAHMCSARFGDGRPEHASSKTNWNGDSFRYDIFERWDTTGRTIALRWSHGGGEGWLTDYDRGSSDQHSILDLIASVPDEARRWDYCHNLAEAISHATYTAKVEERRLVTTAFVEGRLKKRKVRGLPEYNVTIEPK